MGKGSFEELIELIHNGKGSAVLKVKRDAQTELLQIEITTPDSNRRVFWCDEGYVSPADIQQSWSDAVYYSSMPDGDKARLLHMGNARDNEG